MTPPPEDLAGACVLIVEDDPASAKLGALLVRTAGGHPQVATDGASAMRLLLNGLRPAAILLDLALPDMSGLDFARFVRACGPLRDLPIVAQSVSGPGYGRHAALDAGCDDYIAKPLEADSLARQLAACIKSRP